MRLVRSIGAAVIGGLVLALSFAAAQPPGGFGPGGQPPGGGRGFAGPGPGGMGQQTRQILKEFDKNKDGWLNAEERKEARESLKNNPGGGFGPGGRGGPMGGFGRGGTAPKPGPKMTPADVETYPPDKNLYDPTALRTLFL